MKYFDTFTGIGGFTLGIEQAYELLCNAHRGEDRGGKGDTKESEGQRFLPKEGEGTCTKERPNSERHNNLINERPLCVGYSEIDKYASDIYSKHYPEHKNYGDITKIKAEELPDFDCLVGGFPCQAFSIAGKRRGFEDIRGTLFFDLARILREKQPRLFVFENVKGLLSHDQGRTFYTIISTLDELGYDLQWQVLNSKNHGVPQNRERVFIVGHLRGTRRPEVFPFGEGNSFNPKETTQGDYTAYCLQAGGDKHRGSYIKVNKDGIPKRQQETAATLTGGGHSGGNHSDMDLLAFNEYIRRLTPIECERLQGFPDGWTGTGATGAVSDTQRYKCLGNAVTVNVIEDIFTRIFNSNE